MFISFVTDSLIALLKLSIQLSLELCHKTEDVTSYAAYLPGDRCTDDLHLKKS